MEIKLKKIKLQYFKGIRNLELDFNDGPVSEILGQNAAGKSTIADAYSWLLFGKNSQGESDTKFSIKTFDENNVVIPKIEHSVEAVITIDGEENTFKRTLVENWVKKKGALESEFTGNKTSYEINDVPKKKSEYDLRINQIISEEVFKLISNPLEFPTRHWEFQRKMLVDIVGEVDDREIALGNKKFEELLSKLTNKDLEEYKDQLASQRKKLKEAIQHIPSRIDEQRQSMPEEVDFVEIAKQKDFVVGNISKVDAKIEDRNKAIDEQVKKRQSLSDQKFKLQSDNQDIKLETRNNLNSNSNDDKLRELQRQKNNLVSDLANAEIGLQRYQKELEIAENNLKNVSVEVLQLRKDWESTNALKFKFNDDLKCPSCNSPLDAEDIEAEKERLQKEFISNKTKKLNSINEEGAIKAEKEKKIKQNIVVYDSRIDDGKKFIELTKPEIDKLEKQIQAIKVDTKTVVDLETALQSALIAHKTFQSNLTKIQEIETSLSVGTGFDVSDLKEEKLKLQLELDQLNQQLSTKDRIYEIENRIKELSEQESTYAQQLADVEKEQFAVQEFTSAKINKLEDKVNAMFPTLKFRMFDQQVNGGTSETCKAVFKGTDYSDVNTAGKIQAGIEIISVLCNHYNVFAPIWIDNAESILEIPPTKSQQVRLYVKEGYKKLTII